jgi:DNA modification methylase
MWLFRTRTGHCHISPSMPVGGPLSRYFYAVKASPGERREGCADNDPYHPTVKPKELMQWLITLACPPGGKLLDPFNGSGSTGKAAVGLDVGEYVGIEVNPDYLALSKKRIDHEIQEHLKQRNDAQLTLFGD